MNEEIEDGNMFRNSPRSFWEPLQRGRKSEEEDMILNFGGKSVLRGSEASSSSRLLLLLLGG